MATRPRAAPLATQRAIVTRPQAQALHWVAALQAAGVDAAALPLIRIAPAADAGPLRQAWQQLGAQAMVMFVSANAVQHFFNERPAGAPWPAGTCAGSTGPGTTAALLAAGVPQANIAQPAPGAPFETESLWATLRTQDWRARQVLVVRGEEGRDWLADTLRAAGAEVAFLAAYRRELPTLDAAAQQLLAQALALPQAHVWLFSSSQAVDHLAALLPASVADSVPASVPESVPAAPWAAACALASHPRIAQAARRAGFGHVVLVEPTLQAVVQALGGDPGRYNPIPRE